MRIAGVSQRKDFFFKKKIFFYGVSWSLTVNIISNAAFKASALSRYALELEPSNASLFITISVQLHENCLAH